MQDALYPLTLIAVVGCGLTAGVFFAFSTFVMKALARLAPAQGLAAMQAINVTAINFAFMLALFGTALACIAIAALALAHAHQSYVPYLLVGSGLYLVGVVAVTMAFNVPRNEALAHVAPTSGDAPHAWTRYLAEWTAANHVRTVAGLAAAVSLTLALDIG
jgi:uncharacterized membrane protein